MPSMFYVITIPKSIIGMMEKMTILRTIEAQIVPELRNKKSVWPIARNKLFS